MSTTTTTRRFEGPSRHSSSTRAMGLLSSTSSRPRCRNARRPSTRPSLSRRSRWVYTRTHTRNKKLSSWLLDKLQLYVVRWLIWQSILLLDNRVDPTSAVLQTHSATASRRCGQLKRLIHQLRTHNLSTILGHAILKRG